ncbi:MAG: DUF1638 domain-containing protein [Acidimicrobiales bacterium]
MLILACGALAREIRHLVAHHSLEGVALECLPATLHNRPDRIPEAVRARLDRAAGRFDRILVGYGDCGTGGRLDALCDEYRGRPEFEGTTISRMPGAHCYQFFTGHDTFLAMHERDPAVFYLTDYLVTHFERVIMEGLGITAHPELRDLYFGNYTTMIHLAQTDDPLLEERARAAAHRLGLAFDRVPTGFGELESEVVRIAAPSGTRA